MTHSFCFQIREDQCLSKRDGCCNLKSVVCSGSAEITLRLISRTSNPPYGEEGWEGGPRRC